MSAAERQLAAGTTWVWECDGCGHTSWCTFPDREDADEALRGHRENHCRAVAA